MDSDPGTCPKAPINPRLKTNKQKPRAKLGLKPGLWLLPKPTSDLSPQSSPVPWSPPTHQGAFSLKKNKLRQPAPWCPTFSHPPPHPPHPPPDPSVWKDGLGKQQSVPLGPGTGP